MPLQILSEPPAEPSDVIEQLREKILAELPDAEVVVTAGGPGHFEVTVTSQSFEGLSRVKQQQRVYAAIAPLMAGNTPPVHAIDRMVTKTP